MNVAPLTVESMMRSRRRSQPLLAGWLVENLVEAALTLWPEFEPMDRRRIDPSKLTPDLIVQRPHSKRSRWVRRLMDDEAQGLVEYALILGLIAILAIVALLFLGTQIANTLSSIGNSILPSP